MATTLFDITPFVPDDNSVAKSDLPDRVIKLSALAARLSGQVAPETLTTLTDHMSVINSYYSNLIEGHRTLPHEIRAAQQGELSTDPAKRDLQLESLAHIEVQRWIAASSPEISEVFSVDFIRAIHREFYQRVPESLWVVKDRDGKERGKVVPGEWRDQQVSVGRHIPPSPDHLNHLMQTFCETYASTQFKGDRKIMAVLAAHHRFAWVHPFLDGNGRVGRLITDAALKAAGLDSYGVWCLSRGLARSADEYRRQLALADVQRQGDLDGRGALTESGLMGFVDYMLTAALDQVSYTSGLLELGSLRDRIRGYIHARNDSRVPGLGELKPHAAIVLYTALMQGQLERAQALELCGMPDRSASRLLSQLVSEGLLGATSHRSPLKWQIPEHAEPWYFPQLAPAT